MQSYRQAQEQEEQLLSILLDLKQKFEDGIPYAQIQEIALQAGISPSDLKKFIDLK